MKDILLLVAIINIIEGILGIFMGFVYFRYRHDVTLFESFLWILSGVILILVRKRLNKKIEYSKCPKCKESYDYSKLKNGICPKCGIETIDLEKYFKKFPSEKILEISS